MRFFPEQATSTDTQHVHAARRCYLATSPCPTGMGCSPTAGSTSSNEFCRTPFSPCNPAASGLLRGERLPEGAADLVRYRLPHRRWGDADRKRSAPRRSRSQALAESTQVGGFRSRGRTAGENPNHQPRWLLPSRRNRPCRRAAEPAMKSRRRRQMRICPSHARPVRGSLSMENSTPQAGGPYREARCGDC
jgi:hypothetical protein